MEKNEMLEGLVTGKPVIIDEAETSARYGDSTVGYNHNGSSSVTGTVIFSSLAAISGAYAFGKVGYSSPAKSGITEDLGLSLAEDCGILIMFGWSGISFLMYYIYKQAMGISEVFCITGWLAIVFSKDVRWIDLGRLLIGCYAMMRQGNHVHNRFSDQLAHLSAYRSRTVCAAIDRSFLHSRFSKMAGRSRTRGVPTIWRPSGFSYYTSFIFESAGFPNKVGSIPIAVLQWLFSEYSSSISPEDDHFCWCNMLGLCHYRTFILPAGFSCKQGTNSHIGDYWSIGTFFIFAFISVVAIILIGKLVPETKGRTLEELQQHQ
ncbi:hypothetical protein F3Y22_tig00111151pilonHSYRG00122 [Hibiscus syriacus]|uniref:Uncharacterized protein n=1 Tax=Hibiscus syriacus TaxID=106335 RepID=A0A6A2YXT8_HIBSY|nr:hypothetical protein F3Y22_tig00111151pilonHSYRG00122 [Hibiscus syriacus]